MSSTANMPGYEEVAKIGVGATVVYHTRVGNQRQGRTTFPAMVLSQAPDDGTVDLLVFFEPEDILWERRVPRWTEQQPGRCWSPREDDPSASKSLDTETMLEYLADFDDRMKRIEAALPKGELPSFPAPVEHEPDGTPRQKRPYNRRVKPESAGEVEEE
jgi:hypothetical protein